MILNKQIYSLKKIALSFTLIGVLVLGIILNPVFVMASSIVPFATGLTSNTVTQIPQGHQVMFNL